MRILLVSPPHAHGAWIARALSEAAHSLLQVEDLTDGLFWAGEEAFDAAVVIAPERSQLAPLKAALPRLAALMGGAGILAILAQGAGAVDRSATLRAGADGCLDMPASAIELHERLSVLNGRRAANRAARSDQIQADVHVDSLIDKASRAGMTRREMLIFKCLLHHADRPVSRHDLARYWSDLDDVDPSLVNPAISRLRRKLEAYGIEADIETLSGYGYRLRVLRPGRVASSA